MRPVSNGYAPHPIIPRIDDPAAGLASASEAARLPVPRDASAERTTAMDIVMIGLSLAFFAATLAYVAACDAL